MNSRLIELRKKEGLSQQAFADELKVKRGTIANYECGRNEPIDAVITLICNRFNVNENWLRYGEGEMYLPTDREKDLAKLSVKYLTDVPDSFRRRFISYLAKMTDEQWQLLEDFFNELAKKESKE